MRFDEILERLSRSGMRVFTTYDVAKMMGKPTAYASLMLHNSRRVSRIERGKYFIGDASIYEIASNVVFPSYVSMHAGLQYYGLLDQPVIKYSVISLKRHGRLEVKGSQIVFIKARRRAFFGYVNRDGAYIASPEKLFVDCLYFGGVPFSMIKEALDSAKRESLINTGLMERYAVEIRSGALASRLGFLMEQAGLKADGLLPHRCRGYVRISDTGASGVDKKWMVRYD